MYKSGFIIFNNDILLQNIMIYINSVIKLFFSIIK